MRDFRDDDLDQAIQVWDQNRQADDSPTVFSISEVMAAARGADLVAVGRLYDPSRIPREERFDPERRLVPPAVRGTFIPFGGGPRRCIGEAFATLSDDERRRDYDDKLKRGALAQEMAHRARGVRGAVEGHKHAHAASKRTRQERIGLHQQRRARRELAAR